MRVAIVGVGGVGGFYGGKLARAYAGSSSHQIAFVARGAHLQAIKERGLAVRTREADFIAVPWRATDDPRELGRLDLVVFCVKQYDLREAAAAMEPTITATTIVLPLLNGVDNAKALRVALPEAAVLNGCVYISSHIVAPGVVQQTGGSCQLFFGPESDRLEGYRGIEHAFRGASIDVRLTNQIVQRVWEKFMFISPVGAVTALLAKPVGWVLEDVEGGEILKGMMIELEHVARGRGVELPPDIVSQSLRKAASFPYDTKSSLQLDVERGRRAELQAFVGYVADSGRELGIDTPLYRKAYCELGGKTD